jgi:glycosyltransferase involved in cell wall biosynthesis
MSLERLNLLFVSLYPASPPRYGGQRRLEGLMKELARRHEVSAVALFDPSSDPQAYEHAMRAYCREVTLVPSRGEGLTKRLVQARSLLSRTSFEARYFAVPGLQPALDQALSRRDFELVIVSAGLFLSRRRFHPMSSTNARPRLVLDEHNIEFDLQRQMAGRGGPLRRLHNGVNWPKVRREEIEDWGRFDGVTFTSTPDEERARVLVPSMHSAVVPNAVDVDWFRPRPADPPSDGCTVMFFGINDYPPNTDGILFFLREVWPLLAASHPRARIKIVGPRPTREILAQQNERVKVMGAVDDVRPHLTDAAAVIVPLRLGGGTRFKILEAMAMAKPIVSSTIGAEGIDVVHQEHLLLADEPAQFASAVGRVLDDPRLAARLGDSGRTLVGARYSWEAAARRMDEFLHEVLATGAPTSRSTSRRAAQGDRVGNFR